MIKVGINGIGRIGKSILTQCINDKDICVKAINMPNFKIDKITSYLSHDSCHKEVIPTKSIHVINDNTINIMSKDRRSNHIKFINHREPVHYMWEDNNVEYVFDTTGKFLTKESATKHNVDYMIMCAPSKDNTPQYLYNGNHDSYKGENIISGSSCTTNCIVPLLKLLDEKYSVVSSNFLTVHAATASQNVIDGVHLKNRSHRSIFNNIIPHTTGASKSATKILPNLKDKLHGSSVRIPISNVSMVDLNVSLKKPTTLFEIFSFLNNRDEVYINHDKHLVSSDFLTTTYPTIIDIHSSMSMGPNEFKFTIWYDNEWSYSAQVIKLMKHMYATNKKLFVLK